MFGSEADAEAQRDGLNDIQDSVRMTDKEGETVKRIFCLLGAVLLCLFFSACSSAEREEAAATATMEALASVLTAKDSDGLKALFAPFVADQTNAEGAFDADIRHIIAYCSGSIVSQSMKNYYVADSIEPGSYTKDICATYLFGTDTASYTLRVLFRMEAADDPEGSGIRMLEIWSQEDMDKATGQNTSDKLDKFKFHPVDGYIGIWYPARQPDGTIRADTTSGIQYSAGG